MSLVLCVTLWARPGQEQRLVEYEDAVLSLLADHGAHLVARVRALEPGKHPYETQIIELPDETALDAYMSDPRRTARREERDAAIARTQVQRTALV